MTSEESREQDVAADWRDRWNAFRTPVRVGPLWVGPPGTTRRRPHPGRHRARVARSDRRPPDHAALHRAHARARAGEPRRHRLRLGRDSIVAAKLGFAPVTRSTSTRPDRLDPPKRSRQRRDSTCGSPIARRGGFPAEVVVANVKVGMLEALAPRPRSTLVVASGFLPTDAPPLPASRSCAATRDGWVADLGLQRRSSPVDPRP